MDKAQLLTRTNRVWGTVTTPDWPEVKIRVLTLGEVRRFEAAIKADPVAGTLLAVSLAVCDDAGGRIFADSDTDAITEAVGLDTILAVAKAVTDMVQASTSIEDAKKN